MLSSEEIYGNMRKIKYMYFIIIYCNNGYYQMGSKGGKRSTYKGGKNIK